MQGRINELLAGTAHQGSKGADCSLEKERKLRHCPDPEARAKHISVMRIQLGGSSVRYSADMEVQTRLTKGKYRPVKFHIGPSEKAKSDETHKLAPRGSRMPQ